MLGFHLTDRGRLSVDAKGIDVRSRPRLSFVHAPEGDRLDEDNALQDSFVDKYRLVRSCLVAAGCGLGSSRSSFAFVALLLANADPFNRGMPPMRRLVGKK